MSNLVLVVDDDPLHHALVDAAMARLGTVETLHAYDGRQALELYVANAPGVALVICDLNMPECDGIEFITELSKQPQPPPLIIASAASHVIVRAAYVLGNRGPLKVLATLTKPLDLAKLQTTVARIVGRDDVERSGAAAGITARS